MANPIQQGLKHNGFSDRTVRANRAAMANPIQQGLKHLRHCFGYSFRRCAAMANPIQQGLKPPQHLSTSVIMAAAMANPIQQGLKHQAIPNHSADAVMPQWLIQYNKD